ncbi:Hypothetical protein PBC10988_5410 [Planctomycetales bacterium 10988]|nr:Hypothetical protein PBC10988_5410 [Planctomycetales bacterium 10988]
MQFISRHDAVVSLRTLFPEATFFQAKNLLVRGGREVASSIRPGELFISLPQAEAQREADLQLAIKRGAAAILTDQTLITCPIPVCRVNNIHSAFAILMQALAKFPTQHLRCIGVAGRQGKRSYSQFMEAIAKEVDWRLGKSGSLGHFDGKQQHSLDGMTPEPQALTQLLCDMVNQNCSHAVFEMSTEAIRQQRPAGMFFDLICFTEASSETKEEKMLSHLSQSGMAIFNLDHPGCQRTLNKWDGPALTVGMTQDAEIQGKLIQNGKFEQILLITAGEETVPVSIRPRGKRHLTSALLATATALAYGIDLQDIARGLSKVGEISGQLERIICEQSFPVYYEADCGPIEVQRAIQSARGDRTRRVFCVVESDQENFSKHSLQEWASKLLLITDPISFTTNAGGSSLQRSSVHQLQQELPSSAKVLWQPHFEQALEQIVDEITDDDVLLLIGPGFSRFTKKTQKQAYQENQWLEERLNRRPVLSASCPQFSMS